MQINDKMHITIHVRMWAWMMLYNARAKMQCIMSMTSILAPAVRSIYL